MPSECHPEGTHLLMARLRGTAVPGVHMAPLRGWMRDNASCRVFPNAIVKTAKGIAPISVRFFRPFRGLLHFRLRTHGLRRAAFFRRFAAGFKKRSPFSHGCCPRYSTVTDACAPFTVIACNPGSRAPPRVMVRGVCPLAFAWKVSVATHPWPETPLAPLGREAVICDWP